MILHCYNILAVLLADYGALLLAILADLATGVARARRQGIPLTSSMYRRTWTKAGEYLRVMACLTLIDILAAVTAAAAGRSWVPWLTSLAAAGAILVELKSVTENTPAQSRWHRAVDMLSSLLSTLRRIRP